jgi:cytochrome P450 family 150 subfamily A5
MTDFEGADYFKDPSIWPDPFAYFDDLRARCPVQREPHHGVVMVTGYDEAVSVYSDHATWSSCNAVAGPWFPVPLEGDDVSDLIDEHRDELPFSDQLPTFDPPKHTAHRALTMRLITPKRLAENEEFMWRYADRQLADLFAKDRCEFIKEYAEPYTLLVIADLLGVPEEDHDTFRSRLISPVDLTTDEGHMEHRPLAFLYEQFAAYVEDRRRAPRDDVLTGLATATFPDETTPEVEDVAKIAANLFVAGQETTVRLLGAMLQTLGEQPALQELLRAERHRIPNFVEESLRLATPLQGQFRLARRTTSVGGVDLRAGTAIYLLPAAANRDPRRFADPHELQVDRANARQHLAFGHGIHTCAGAPLARAEARVSLERILDTMLDIRISEEHHGPPDDRRFEYLPTYLLRGLTNLHLDYTPNP